MNRTDLDRHITGDFGERQFEGADLEESLGAYFTSQVRSVQFRLADVRQLAHDTEQAFLTGRPEVAVHKAQQAQIALRDVQRMSQETWDSFERFLVRILGESRSVR